MVLAEPEMQFGHAFKYSMLRYNQTNICGRLGTRGDEGWGEGVVRKRKETVNIGICSIKNLMLG